MSDYDLHGPEIIRCEICGKSIMEYGYWTDGTAGVCSGPCERELCGDCADWDINGECCDCQNSPCGKCYAKDHAGPEDEPCAHCKVREKECLENIAKYPKNY
jgi:hypothetical protein